MEEDIDLIFYYGTLDWILDQFTQIKNKVDKQTQYFSERYDLDTPPELKFIPKSSSPRRVERMKKSSAKRFTLLTSPSHEMFQEKKILQEGYDGDKLVVGLTERENDVLSLISVLLKNLDSKKSLNNMLLVGNHMEDFLNFFRKQDLLYYAKRGKYSN